jgi:hypothetical protein
MMIALPTRRSGESLLNRDTSFTVCRHVPVALPWEVQPFWVTKLVAHEVHVPFSAQRMGDQLHPNSPLNHERTTPNIFVVRQSRTRISLCKAKPRSITGVSSVNTDMCVYICSRQSQIRCMKKAGWGERSAVCHTSLSISQKAMVLSPTNAWSWLSA